MTDIAFAIIAGLFNPLNGFVESKDEKRARIRAAYAQMSADGMAFYPGKLTPPLLTIEEWRERELQRIGDD